MEDDLKTVENLRRPKYFWQMEANIIIRKKMTASIFWNMEDNLNILAIGRLHYFLLVKAGLGSTRLS